METLLKFLNSVHPMSPGLIDHLSSILKKKDLGKKDYLLKAGHISQSIYFITKGLVRLFYLNGDSEISTWFLKEGDVVISVKSFFLQKVSKESIQALEETEAWYISYKDLLDTINRFPEFLMIAWLLTQKYYILSEQKQEPLRMARAPDRYHYLLENFPDLILRIPAKYLASYLGINETTLSKIKKPKKK